jgi:hypothetical protein
LSFALGFDFWNAALSLRLILPLGVRAQPVHLVEPEE